MTNYSNDAAMVRVDFFRPGGKWYMTEAHRMYDWDDWNMWGQIGDILDQSRPEREAGWWKNFTIVVLEPYNKNAHPIMIPAERSDD